MTKFRTEDWCKHYRGMHKKDTCEAGVAFSSLPGHGTQLFMTRCPCFGPRSGCEKAEYPTPEEVAASEAAMKKRFNGVVIARARIVEACGGEWSRGCPGKSGVIDCPVCNCADSLRYSRAGVNGHIHARCSTEGCLSWME